MLAFGTHLTPTLFRLSFLSRWRTLYRALPSAVLTRARYLVGICKTHRRARLHPLNTPPRLPVLPGSLIAPLMSSERGWYSLFPALYGCHLGYHSPGQSAPPPFLRGREPDVMVDAPNVLGDPLGPLRLHSATQATHRVPFALFSSPSYLRHLP